MAPQVSGLSFTFDPSQPPGQRIVAGSARVRGEPLQRERSYSLATKVFLLEG